jgi:hypothetical protein
MARPKDDGGPAFPQIESRVERDYDNAPSYAVPYSYGGMTLRDYFAAKCMADVLGHFSWDEPEIDKAAAFAFKLADAMLKAREGK